MTEIRFYHVQKKSVEQTVFDLCERALTKGHKILIRLRDESDIQKLNDFLWAAKPESFLPHGSASDTHAEVQPILLTAANENKNNADMVIFMPDAQTEGAENFNLCCAMIDGRDEQQIAKARGLYRDWKAQNHQLSYWQQTDSGKWDQKS